MIDADQSGEPRFPAVWFVAEVYADESAALEAVGELDVGEGELKYPPEPYDEETWENTILPAATTALKEKLDGGVPEVAAVTMVAKDFGIDAAYVQVIADGVVPV